MFKPELVGKLSDEEQEILRKYSERITQCQAKLKGDSRATMTERPAAVLPTYQLSPEREEITVESVPADFSRSMERSYHTPKRTSLRSSRSSQSGTPRNGQYAEATYSSRMRSKSPREREEKSTGRKATGRLDLRLIPNLEAEVGKLLRISYRFSRKSSEMRAEFLTCDLFRKYSATKCVGKA